MPDGAACERAKNAMMTGEMPDRSTNQSAFDAAFRLRRRAGANHKQQQRTCGKQSGHLILSAVMRVIGRPDNTVLPASFRARRR
jgi:hypothetical protein